MPLLDPIAIDVRQDNDGIDVPALLRAGRHVTVYDSAGVFWPFDIAAHGAAYRVEPAVGVLYGLFADPDDALRYGLTNFASPESLHADSY